MCSGGLLLGLIKQRSSPCACVRLGCERVGEQPISVIKLPLKLRCRVHGSYLSIHSPTGLSLALRRNNGKLLEGHQVLVSVPIFFVFCSRAQADLQAMFRCSVALSNFDWTSKVRILSLSCLSAPAGRKRYMSYSQNSVPLGPCVRYQIVKKMCVYSALWKSI